jgi:ABC-type branched-subunit amino acid transport system substrate-binding protein
MFVAYKPRVIDQTSINRALLSLLFLLVLIWAPTLTTPANQRFMKRAEATLQRTPAYFHAVMYSAGRWIAEAARLVDGQVEASWESR